MHTAMLRRMVKRLEAQQVGSRCPECAAWPDAIAVRIVEVIVEPGEPIPPPDKTDPTLFHCEACGRTHRPRVVELVEGD